MSDEDKKDRKHGLDLIGESTRKTLERQEEQRRELMVQVLGPSKALQDALGVGSIAKMHFWASKSLVPLKPLHEWLNSQN